MTDASTAAGPDTRRDRILKAAEDLFAREGYHGTSMRAIAREAGVGLPLVVYHFETKEQLYTAIFLGHSDVNERRLSLLRTVDLSAPNALDLVVAAFVDPVLDLHEDPYGISYARLILREVTEPSSPTRPAIRGLFAPIAQAFIAALKTVLPGKPSGFHEWAYLFTVGALTMSAFDDRVGETARRRSLKKKREYLKRYIAAALRHG